ncbi:hypothetical protein O0L34_g15572 [Tuta absoluta]|nr:hypothetical protein O0L34_g15572 [Tuta absoluta]
MIPYANDDKRAEADGSVNNYGGPNENKIEWHHEVLLNRPAKVVAAGFVLAVLAPMLIYHYLFFRSIDLPPPDGYSTGSCFLSRATRIPCGIKNVTDVECHPQCCYDYELHVCFHRHPSRFTYIVDGEWTENKTLTPRTSTVPYKRQETAKIQMSIDEISSTHVTVTFFDPNTTAAEGRRISDKNYTWAVSTPELNVIVNDTSGHEIFNTVRGPIIASDNIWEVAFKTTEEYMFGFGEIPIVEGTVKVLYNHNGGFNGIPMIFSKTGDTYHGLLIDIVEPTEVRFESGNQVVVRTITKRGMKFHLFTGPQPKDIMNDVLGVIGFKNELEYWMLGVHICSETPTPTNHSKAYEDFVAFTTKAASEKLPYDSHCGATPVVFHDNCQIIEHRDNVIKGLEVIRSRKKKFVPHISPFILYEEADIETNDNSTETVKPRGQHYINCLNLVPQFENHFLKTTAGNIYQGLVNNKTVIYPDYGTASEEFMYELWSGPEIDGVVLENTWPIDESLKLHNETRLLLPYFNQHLEAAFNSTPQWNITRPDNATYMYTHNQYGNHFSEAFKRTLQKRIPMYTSTPWMTGGNVNRQGIHASWANLQKELVEAALAGISGNWFSSSPICGDTNYNDTTQIQLCVKWYMAASFLPLVKIHSKGTLRHPLAFSGTNRANILKAINHRYSLLPYFYTTLQKGPLLRPMFYQFPFSKNITNSKTQFSVGDDLLIAPNLQPSQSHVHIQMPPGRWFEFLGGQPLKTEEGETITMATTDADFLTFIRGGSIIVMQKDSKETAEETRKSSSYYLTVALHCEVINTTETSKAQNVTVCKAEGELYMNENMTLILEANYEEITVKALGDDYAIFCDPQNAAWSKELREINVFGLDGTHNNFDNYRNVGVSADLCQLQNQEEIVLKLV